MEEEWGGGILGAWGRSTCCQPLFGAPADSEEAWGPRSSRGNAPPDSGGVPGSAGIPRSQAQGQMSCWPGDISGLSTSEPTAESSASTTGQPEKEKATKEFVRGCLHEDLLHYGCACTSQRVGKLRPGPALLGVRRPGQEGTHMPPFLVKCSRPPGL